MTSVKPRLPGRDAPAAFVADADAIRVVFAMDGVTYENVAVGVDVKKTLIVVPGATNSESASAYRV